MKTIISLILASALSFISASAAVTTTITSTIWNKYLVFGSGAVVHSDPCLFSSVDFNFDNGFAIGAWNSTSFNGKQDPGDEIDLSLSWSGKFGDWKTMVMFSYFDLCRLENYSGDVFYAKLSVGRTIGDYDVSMTVRDYIPTGGSHFEGGWLIGASVGRNFAITEKLSLCLGAELNYDDGGFGANNALILNPNACLSYKLTESLTWNVLQTSIYIPVTDRSNRETDATWGSGFGLTF